MKYFCYLSKFLAAAVVVILSACEKEEDKEGLSFIKNVPYYHFTDDDRLWLGARSGDEWHFENSRGYQRIYRVGIIEMIKAKEEDFGSPGIPSPPPKLLSYYDQVTLRLSRTDSMLGAADLRFSRRAALLTNLSSGGIDKHTSRFYAKGEWYDFVGNTDLISDYFSCRGMKFPSGPTINGQFMQLTVRGRQYNEVIAFIGTQREPECRISPASFMQEMYYDRRVGMVKMVSKAGEVWNRVP